MFYNVKHKLSRLLLSAHEKYNIFFGCLIKVKLLLFESILIYMLEGSLHNDSFEANKNYSGLVRSGPRYSEATNFPSLSISYKLTAWP